MAHCSNITEPHCSYLEFIDFFFGINISLLYNLRIISRDFKWLLNLIIFIISGYLTGYLFKGS